MAKQEQTSMPQSGAGLLRFYDVDASLIEISPKVVLAVCVAVIVIIECLHLMKFG